MAGKTHVRFMGHRRNNSGLPDPVELVMQLMSIPGASGQERQVAEFVQQKLLQAGAQEDWIQFDSAHRRMPQRGQLGNLILSLPGTRPGPRRMLVAHLDTVPLCVGTRPVRRGRQIRSADTKTGLGADNRAGTAVLLYTALQMLRGELSHPPLTLLWTVQEEVGLQGARHISRSRLRRPQMAFNWDGGSASKLTIGATGGYRMKITVRGKASHAGGSPEKGISAIAIASLAIAQLYREGWHGDVHQGNCHGTSNVGIIQGGVATNVVPDLVHLQAEARSHDPQFRQQIVQQIERAFREAAAQVQNDRRQTGTVRFEGRLDYEAFCLPTDSPSVQVAAAAVRAIGREPELAVANGGLDANWLTAHGIPTVTMGCGQLHQHTTDEALDMDQFLDACRIARLIASAAEE